MSYIFPLPENISRNQEVRGGRIKLLLLLLSITYNALLQPRTFTETAQIYFLRIQLDRSPMGLADFLA